MINARRRLALGRKPRRRCEKVIGLLLCIASIALTGSVLLPALMATAGLPPA